MKYAKDGPFDDPVVRCCDCQRIIFRAEIARYGGCPECGNKRIRNILTLKPIEMQMLRDKQIDENFLKLFEAIE